MKSSKIYMSIVLLFCSTILFSQDKTWKLDSIIAYKVTNGIYIPNQKKIFHYDVQSKDTIVVNLYSFDSKKRQFSKKVESKLSTHYSKETMYNRIDSQSWSVFQISVDSLFEFGSIKTISHEKKLEISAWEKNYNDTLLIQKLQKSKVNKNEDWSINRKVTYEYDSKNRLTSKKTLQLNLNLNGYYVMDRLEMKYKNNEIIRLYFDQEMMTSELILQWKEISTLDHLGRISTKTNFTKKDNTLKLDSEESYKYVKDKLVKSTTQNYNNGAYDLYEKYLIYDKLKRKIEETTIYKNKKDVKWDTLEQIKYTYPFDNTTSPSSIYNSFERFSSTFDKNKNFIAAKIKNDNNSPIRKIEQSYNYDLLTSQVMAVSNTIGSSTLMTSQWKNNNPITKRKIIVFKDGHWKIRREIKYYYSKILKNK